MTNGACYKQIGVVCLRVIAYHRRKGNTQPCQYGDCLESKGEDAAGALWT